MSSKEEEFLDKRTTKGIILSLKEALEIRKDKELIEVLEEIEALAWYNLNKGSKAKGLVTREQMPGVIKKERGFEKKYGFERMNKEYSEFEWGYLMGKLQAIRWILGYD